MDSPIMVLEELIEQQMVQENVSVTNISSPIAMFRGDAGIGRNVDLVKNLDADDATPILMSSKVSESLSDKTLFQVKPVSAKMLDVLYTMY
jgi:hypothetical protein